MIRSKLMKNWLQSPRKRIRTAKIASAEPKAKVAPRAVTSPLEKRVWRSSLRFQPRKSVTARMM